MTPLNNKKAVAGALVLAGAALVSYVSQHEGTRHVPYKDQGGVWTVCQGHTGRDVVPGKRYTQAECDAFLATDLAVAGRGVLSCVHVPLNQHQYDAYTDFAFNIGVGAFCRSSIALQLNQRHYSDACNRLMLYDHIGNTVNVGLRNRREDERKLCLMPQAAS